MFADEQLMGAADFDPRLVLALIELGERDKREGMRKSPPAKPQPYNDFADRMPRKPSISPDVPLAFQLGGDRYQDSPYGDGRGRGVKPESDLFKNKILKQLVELLTGGRIEEDGSHTRSSRVPRSREEYEDWLESQEKLWAYTNRPKKVRV